MRLQSQRDCRQTVRQQVYEKQMHRSERYASLAMESLAGLEGCEVHSTVILAHADEKLFGKLGAYVTCDPVYEQKTLYHH